MTNLNIALSTMLQNQLLGQPGVWFDVVGFDNNGLLFAPTPIVSNGVVNASGLLNISIPTANSGKVYLIEWSGPSTSTDPIAAFLANGNGGYDQSKINVASAQTNNFRYDSVELTLSGPGAAAANDVANLTSVTGFGFPMQLSDANGSRGYNISGSTVFADIQAIKPSSTSLVFDFNGTGPLTGDRYGVSPASASQVANPPFSPADWTSYIASLTTTTLKVAGFYNGSPDANGIWHNQGFFNYHLTSDGTNFWLSPQDNSQIKGHIKFTAEQLANSIYATNANVEVYTNKTDATPYTIFNPNPSTVIYDGTTATAKMNTGANNQWGNVIKQLVSGLDAGYWGGTGKSPNPYVTTAVNLNNNWNFDPSYAFGQGGNSQPSFDPYAAIFFKNSNSYGSGYSDQLMALYKSGGPLLSLSNSAGNDDVASLNLTVYADGDTPQGYTQPNIYNYIAPPVTAGYAAPAGSPGLNLTLNFNAPAGTAGQTTWTLDQTKAQVTVNVLTGFTSGAPTWTPITLAATKDTASSLWWNWQVTASGTGGYTATPLSGSQQPEGAMVLTGLPFNTALGNGISWYQIGVSSLDGSSSKTFNLYTTTQADPNSVPNPTLATSTGSSISGTSLTIGTTLSGAFAPGMFITGAGIPAGTMITAPASGGIYPLNQTATVSGVAINGVAPGPVSTSTGSTISNGVLTVAGTVTGNYFDVGVAIQGANIPAGTIITALGTGTGGAGTYTINNTGLSITTAQPITAASTVSYVTASGYGFVPTLAGQQIDGGALVTAAPPPAPYVTDAAISIAFQNGSFTTIDPSLMKMGLSNVEQGIYPMQGTPFSPIAGTVDGTGKFTMFPTPPSQFSPTNMVESASTASVAFGWVGLAPIAVTPPQVPNVPTTPPGQQPGPITGAPVNPNYQNGVLQNTGWDSGYTNKISGLGYAVVIVERGGAAVTGAVAQADIDGQWQTPNITLAPGTYSVTMQEFPEKHGGFRNYGPVGIESSPLTLTVTAPSQAIAAAGVQGDAIGFGPNISAGNAGSWIRLDPLDPASHLAAGATLLLYGTDAAGLLVSRADGHAGADVTLQQAALARIGSAQGDSGVSLMKSGQSVYLPANAELHFAVVGNDGTIDLSPDVSTATNADGSVVVTVDGWALAASSNLTSPDAANLASSQRSSDLPIVFLAQGATVDVHVAGASGNVNTLGFVQVDVDAKGAISVGGVAYGATDAFYSAVQSNLDAGFSLAAGGGTFDQTRSWTVDGASGFYAPVMRSQNGETFVLGSANADGREHIRILGENVFGIEDLTADRGSDFDYNDMIVGISIASDFMG
jgi:hypothetical protein